MSRTSHAANVSNSQLYHYFDDEDDLTSPHATPLAAGLDTAIAYIRTYAT